MDVDTANAVYTVRDAAKQLGISESTLYELVRRRKISHHRVGLEGGRILFTAQDIKDFLAASRVDAGTSSARGV